MFNFSSVSLPHSQGRMLRFRNVWVFLFVEATATMLLAQPANPPRLTYATYTASQPGGSALYAFAVDPDGYAYLGGGPYSGSGCAFLTRLNQTGSAAVWSVCLPVPQVNALALDGKGYIYIAGGNRWNETRTLSTIMKLSPDAQQTIYSTPLAGTFAAGLALDRSGNAYVIGSLGTDFKPTPGAYSSTPAFSFVAKLDGNGAVQYAASLDIGTAQGNGSLAVDSRGQVWAVGSAVPTSAPPTGCGISVNCGSASGVRKLDASGAKLLVSKTFGGGPTGDRTIGRYDKASEVSVDRNDSVWVVGTAESSGVPTTPGPIEPTRPPTPPQSFIGGLGYAVKFSASGDILYGTYLETSDSRNHSSVAIDSQSRPHFALNGTGFTTSGGTSRIMVLSADAGSVVASTDFNSFVQAIALDGRGGLYVAGNTPRLAFLTTPGAYQELYPGGPLSGFTAGYIAKFDLTTVAPTANFSTMVNAASLVPGDNPEFPEGAVAPGEIVTLFGQNLPANPKVTFDGRAAPILYTDAKQINAVVPFEVSTPSTVVSLEGVRSYVLLVWPAVPALFTADGSGHGQLAALNEDGTVNSSANPAKVGSVVAVYMTGVGAMSPPIADGQIGPLLPLYPVPVLGVSALMNNSTALSDGIPAPILFVGQAPGLIAGAVQVNVQIPVSSPSGDVPLTIYLGPGYQTQFRRTTIAVQ